MASELKHNIDHEVTKNGIVYKIAKTQEEHTKVLDFMFNVFVKGELSLFQGSSELRYTIF